MPYFDQMPGGENNHNAADSLLTAVVGEHPIFGVGGKSEVLYSSWICQACRSDSQVRMTTIYFFIYQAIMSPSMRPVQGSQAMLQDMHKAIVRLSQGGTF